MSRLEQLLWAVLLVFFICLLVVSVVFHRVRAKRFIDIDREIRQIDYQLAIDINTAEWAELTVLPGISETYARRIVDYRQEHGAFDAVEDLVKVSGIGEKRLAQIRTYLYVNPSVDVNDGPKSSELQADLR